jgi:hypothetical protein
MPAKFKPDQIKPALDYICDYYAEGEGDESEPLSKPEATNKAIVGFANRLASISKDSKRHAAGKAPAHVYAPRVPGEKRKAQERVSTFKVEVARLLGVKAKPVPKAKLAPKAKPKAKPAKRARINGGDPQDPHAPAAAV